METKNESSTAVLRACYSSKRVPFASTVLPARSAEREQPRRGGV